MNAIAERWIESCRREATDRILLTGARHLRLVVDEYADHHNTHRPHRSLRQRAPDQLTDPEPPTASSKNHISRREGRSCPFSVHGPTSCVSAMGQVAMYPRREPALVDAELDQIQVRGKSGGPGSGGGTPEALSDRVREHTCLIARTSPQRVEHRRFCPRSLSIVEGRRPPDRTARGAEDQRWPRDHPSRRQSLLADDYGGSPRRPARSCEPPTTGTAG
ncbi:integrase core domain-containing protein [Streptomyces sp. NPDC020096]